MIFSLLFFIFPVLSSDVAYFPNICPPLPHELSLCIEQTLTFDLTCSDSENPTFYCNSESLPEKCYFISLSSELSINSNGKITFTSLTKGIFTHSIILWDKNTNINNLFNFDYYNMARKIDLTFTVYNNSDIPEVYIKDYENCLENCGLYFDLICNQPFISKITGKNPSRYIFSTVLGQNPSLTVLESGIFYGTPNCVDSNYIMKWEIQVYDKKTKCMKIVNFGKLYPNMAPEIILDKSFYEYYDSEDFIGRFEVRDINHGFEEIDVSVLRNDFKVENKGNGVYEIYSIGVLGYGNYDIEVKAMDNGIKGINKKTSQAKITLKIKALSEFIPVSLDEVYVVKYSGDFYYMPEYENPIPHYFDISIGNSGVKVIDSSLGTLYWEKDIINQYPARSIITIIYTVYEIECSCTSPGQSSNLLLHIIDPPIIYPPAPIFTVNDCSIEFELNIVFEFPNQLTYEFDGFFEHSPTVINRILYWNTPSTLDNTFLSLFVIASYEDYNHNIIKTSMNFYVILKNSEINFSVIPESATKAFENQDFSLNLEFYTIYDLKRYVSYSIENSDILATIQGTFLQIEKSSLSLLFIDQTNEAQANINIKATGLCNYNTNIIITISVFNIQPTLNIESEYHCVARELCEISFKDGINPVDKITEGSLERKPDGMILINYIKIEWTPSEEYGSSGWVVYKLMIYGVELTSEFIVYVHRKPVIEDFPLAFYSAVEGEFWYNEISFLSYEGFDVTCTNSDISKIDEGPILTGYVFAWYPVTVTYNGIIQTLYTGFLNCTSNSLSTTILYNINLYSYCYFDLPKFFTAVADYYFEHTIHIISPDSREVTLISTTKPKTLSIHKLNQTSQDAYFLLRWFVDLPSFPNLVLNCSTSHFSSEIYPGNIQVSNTTIIGFVIETEKSIVNVKTCNYEVIIGFDWICEITGDNIESCDVDSGDITGMTAKMVDNICRIKWLKMDIEEYGVKISPLLRVRLYNGYGKTHDVYFILYPNDIPEYIGQSEFVLDFGLVPFNMKFNVDDQDGVVCELENPFEFMSLVACQEVIWWSPETGTVPSIKSFTIKITDKHNIPYTIKQTIFIYHENITPSPKPICPDPLSVYVNELWTWNTNSIIPVVEYKLINEVEGMKIIDGVISYIPSISFQSDLITVIHINTLGANGTCSFYIYPNYPPQIQDDTTLTIIEDQIWYYRVVVSDQNEQIQGLNFEIISSCTWAHFSEYGLIVAFFTDYAQVNTEVFQLTIKVTDKWIIPASTIHTYNIIIQKHDDKPQFQLPTTKSQYIINNLEEDIPWQIPIKIYDEDTPYTMLSLEIIYNPYNLYLTQDSISLNNYIISWNPSNLITSSGLITLFLTQNDNLANNATLDIIIYNIKQTDDSPFFLNTLYDISITEKDYLEIQLNISDIDSYAKDISISLKGHEDTRLEILGFDAIVRYPYPVDENIIKTIDVTVCSKYNCKTEGFLLSISHVNDPPYFTQILSEVFGIYGDSHKGSFKVIAIDPDKNLYKICEDSQEISIDGSDYIVWTPSLSDQVFEVFKVFVTDEGKCEDLKSYTEYEVMFCQCFDCCYLPTSLEYTYASLNFCIIEPGITKIYIGSYAFNIDSSGCCKIDNTYFLSQVRVSVKNDYGISTPFDMTWILNLAQELKLTIYPSFFYGLGNEIITIISENVYITGHWTCWILENNVYIELVFYNSIPANSKGYCLLPYKKYSVNEEYQLKICPKPLQDQDCKVFNMYLLRQIEIEDKNYSGFAEGGYFITFTTNIEDWISNKEFNPYFLFDIIIVKAESYTSNSITVRIPPGDPNTKVKVHISPVYPPVWSTNTFEYSYTDLCYDINHYCNTTTISKCPIGHYCPDTYGTLIVPLPCRAGSYQSNIEESTCFSCTAGFQCPYDTMSDMEICEKGFICDREGVDFPYATCPPGYYCPAGTDTQVLESKSDNYYNLHRNGLIFGTDHWLIRGQGYQTPPHYTGSHIPKCINKTLSNTNGLNPPKICPDTYYCLLAVTTNDPLSDDITDRKPELCASGYRCKSGDGEMFNNTNACKAGYFCPDETTKIEFAEFIDNCAECPCPIGYSCPFQGMVKPNECETGTYQNETGSVSCKNCEPGYYCDVKKLTEMTESMLCPVKNYCPSGSKQPSSCEPSTYNNKTGQANCTECDIGKFCPIIGMDEGIECEPSYMCNESGLEKEKDCQAGYYCEKGVNHFNASEVGCPENFTCPIPCPPGHYCPTKSSEPLKCQAGDYQSEYTQKLCKKCEPGYVCKDIGMTDHELCPAGYYCETEGLQNPTAACPDGYFCPNGTISIYQGSRFLAIFDCDNITEDNYPGNAIPCKAGTYCPSGTNNSEVDSPGGPKSCSAGYYNDRCGQGKCIECPDGYYCGNPGMIAPVICPNGTYRSGFVLQCQACSVGTWSAGNVGLKSKEDCQPCPAGFYCEKSGLFNQENLILCIAGFYCPSGTRRPILSCPSGYFCPPGLGSEEDAYKFPCPPGYFCPMQTAISQADFDKCKNNITSCVVGKKCPSRKYCPAKQQNGGIDCPSGTTSNPGGTSIFNCVRDTSIEASVHGELDLLDPLTSSGLDYVVLNPLDIAYFTWDTKPYPCSNIPGEYLPTIKYYYSGGFNKIPIIQQEDYQPTNRIPLPINFTDTISTCTTIYNFAILSHSYIKISFYVDFLNGLYNDSHFINDFKNSIKLIQKQSPTRNQESQFLTVLSRVSSSYFDEPSNLNIHSLIQDNNMESYDTYKSNFVQEVSITMLNDMNTSKEFYPQTDMKLWDKVSYSQKLYPLSYLPYITDCDDYGAFVPLYKLYTHESCNIVSKSDTSTVEILQPGKVPNGDSCDFSFMCHMGEKMDTSTKPWFSSYELSKADIFYITRPQLTYAEYDKAIPLSASTSANQFNLDYYGSGNLIAVKAYRGIETYSAGKFPKNIKLVIEYYQKTLVDKEILRAGIYFSNFTSDLSDRSYKFTFVFNPLGWKDCLDLFAFDEALYYVFVILVCLFIFINVVAFWLVNYIRSTILPRPSLKISLYFSYSVRALTGVGKAIGPVFGLMISLYYGLKLTSVLLEVQGDYDDPYPISLNSVNDTTRVTNYKNGRLGTCFLILSWYIIIKSTHLMFPKIEKAENPLQIPGLNARTQKLKSMYIWGTFPVLIFCVCSFQFAKSAVFLQYQTLFLVVFKIVNGRLVEAQKVKFKDNLYILPYFGALSLNTTLITVKVGAFTAFLTGYLTNAAIKIFKRAFFEPYRISIANFVLRIKKRFGLGGSADITQGLGFKDRVYIEQINDLGANSMELVASVLFPAMIVFNFIFYEELKLTIAKSFLKYFIVFSTIQAFAEVGYDIFLNNAIECKTGRLLSEKIVELKTIFDERETNWALASALPHSGRRLIPEIDSLLRLGFSSQYFFTMSMAIIGIILQVYSIDLWMISLYNPFKDIVTLILITSLPPMIYISEKGYMIIVNKIKKHKKIVLRNTEATDFYKEIKFYIDRELETQVSVSRVEILAKSIARAVYDKYKTGLNEKKRKMEIFRLLKLLDEACQIGTVPLENISNIEDLPLPFYRQRLERLKPPPVNSVNSKLKKKQGYWSPILVYPWNEIKK
ncbi:hypothetical protein SteCoe_13301 [Stentor coeruleus]|uniref:Uncharacterized protein n=1 Tax=Stentor coeruleus TaxID=5963 RepID=A0A1R2C8S5_9CILI|nr:hypothetical protein SteCoe_15013 [Stentor coeruleus]OMJ85391.1 hypothetical protein SteCoe_13301 [Stentor coeruleus]